MSSTTSPPGQSDWCGAPSQHQYTPIFYRLHILGGRITRSVSPERAVRGRQIPFQRSEMSGIWGVSRFARGPNGLNPGGVDNILWSTVCLPPTCGLFVYSLILGSLFNGDDNKESTGACIPSYHLRCPDNFLYSGTPEKMNALK